MIVFVQLYAFCLVTDVVDCSYSTPHGEPSEFGRSPEAMPNRLIQHRSSSSSSSRPNYIGLVVSISSSSVDQLDAGCRPLYVQSIV